MNNDDQDCTYTELLSAILNDYVGQGKQFKVAPFARDAGVSKEVIYGIQRGEYRPSFEAAMRIVRILPEEGAARFFAGLGFTGLRRIEGLEGCHREAHEALADASHRYAQFFRDGRIDHREEREVRQRIIPRVTAVLARLREAL